MELQAERAQEGKARVHARFEVSEKESDGDKLRCSGRFMRAAETVPLGEPLHLVLKDDQGKVCYRAEIRVEQHSTP